MHKMFYILVGILVLGFLKFALDERSIKHSLECREIICDQQSDAIAASRFCMWKYSIGAIIISLAFLF